MPRLIHIALLFLCVTLADAQAQPFQVERLSYVGGGLPDETIAARISENGTIVIAGRTTSTDYPTTATAYQRLPAGAADATLTVISPAGGLSASTYVGSDEDDEIYDVAIDADGSILVLMETESDPFLVSGSVGTVEDSKRPLLLRFSANLSTVLAAFHFKIDHSIDQARLSVAPDGRIAIVGTTEEDLFPTTANALQPSYGGDHDGLICVVNSSLSSLLYASYVGEERKDSLHAVAFSEDGTLYTVGVIGTGDTTTDLRFLALSYTWTVIADKREANPTERSATALAVTPTSVVLGMMSNNGPVLDVRSLLGVSTRTIPTGGYLDAIRGCAADDTSALVSGSWRGASTTARFDLTNGAHLWSHESGGSAADTCLASRITASGLVTAGVTTSYDLPTTSGAYQQSTKDNPAAVFDHWFSLASASTPPRTVLRITPSSIMMDSVIIRSTRHDSVRCVLVSGPTATVSTASFLTTVPGLTLETTVPQVVSSSSSPVFVVTWNPVDTGSMSTTLRIATADTVIDILVQGTARDTASPPPPPPTKARVTMYDVDLGVIPINVSSSATVNVRIDSVASLMFDSVKVSTAQGATITVPPMPRAAVVPNDQLVFGITPTMAGLDSAVVTLSYPDSSATAVVRWVVLSPGSASWVTADIDRGTLTCGEADTSWITVRNIGAEKGEVRDITLSGDTVDEIVLQYPTLPVDVEAGGSLQIMVIITPVVAHDVVARCIVSVDDDGGDDDTLSAQIRYRSVVKRIHHPDDDPTHDTVSSGACPDCVRGSTPDTASTIRFAVAGRQAHVGESFAVPVVCTSGGDWLRSHSATSVTLTLQYRRSVLTIQTPITDPVVAEPMRTVTVTSSSIMTSDTAALLQLTACLGDADSSELRITNITIAIDTGRIVVDTALAATVQITDTWPSDKPRHVDRDTTMPALEIFPNPAADAATLSLHACTPGSTVMVHSVEGRFVFEWASSMTEGIQDVHLTLPGGLTPGMYVCTYRSNNTAVHRSFVILR